MFKREGATRSQVTQAVETSRKVQNGYFTADTEAAYPPSEHDRDVKEGKGIVFVGGQERTPRLKKEYLWERIVLWAIKQGYIQP